MDFSTLQASANFQALVNETKKDFTSLEEMTPKAIMPERTIIQSAKVLQRAKFYEMSSESYHSSSMDDFISSGKLKSCKTPLHLKMAMETPAPSSVHLNIGSAFHELILEPEKFEYRLFDDTAICAELIEQGYKSPRSTNAYKEWHKQFEDEAGNLLPDVLPHEAFHSMWKLKKELRKDAIILELFNGSQNEVSHFMTFDYPVKHTFGNLKVKVRPDGIKIATVKDAENFAEFGIEVGDLIIISVKTTIDASPDGFYRQCKKNQYELSEAFYSDVLYRFYDKEVHTVFLTLEKDGQAFTGHYLLRYCSEEFLQRGRELYQRNLQVYCESKDLSEGYQSFTNSSIVEI